ncbi:MAG TPA: gas vesicle protein GvpG [Candidatus Limnocylindrales bacterium]|nr:gas vesicle protein GvpG [Candidatus Limnocylindrales bacterium]
MLPFTPVRGVAWVAGRVAEAAIQEIHSPAALRARLRDLALRLESGMISESEFDQEEDEILRRLSMAGLAGRDARL